MPTSARSMQARTRNRHIKSLSCRFEVVELLLEAQQPANPQMSRELWLFRYIGQGSCIAPLAPVKCSRCLLGAVGPRVTLYNGVRMDQSMIKQSLTCPQCEGRNVVGGEIWSLATDPVGTSVQEVTKKLWFCLHCRYEWHQVSMAPYWPEVLSGRF
jgi:ribosomal protein L37AE/L43A